MAYPSQRRVYQRPITAEAQACIRSCQVFCLTSCYLTIELSSWASYDSVDAKILEVEEVKLVLNADQYLGNGTRPHCIAV